MNHSEPEVDLLTPGEVAVLFRVHPKTVAKWAQAGKIKAIRTPGNQRRFSRSDVDALLGEWAPGRDGDAAR